MSQPKIELFTGCLEGAETFQVNESWCETFGKLESSLSTRWGLPRQVPNIMTARSSTSPASSRPLSRKERPSGKKNVRRLP